MSTVNNSSPSTAATARDYAPAFLRRLGRPLHALQRKLWRTQFKTPHERRALARRLLSALDRNRALLDYVSDEKLTAERWIWLIAAPPWQLLPLEEAEARVASEKERAMMLQDARRKFLVDCVRCGAKNTVEVLKLRRTSMGSKCVEAMRYHCEECGKTWE